MTAAASDNDAFVMSSIAGSFVAHVALLIATAAAVAPLRVAVDDAPSDDGGRPSTHQPFGWSYSEDLRQAVLAETESFGMTGLPGSGHEGAMGDFASPPSDNRFGVRGPAVNPDPHIAESPGFTETTCYGCIGTTSVFAGDPHAPTAPWGRVDALGEDPESARGHYWANTIGAAAGSDGVRGSGNSDGDAYGDGEGLPFANYVHRCRLQ